MPGFPSIAQAFAENVIYMSMLKFWEMAQYQQKTTSKLN
jgi:hypothetical protein